MRISITDNRKIENLQEQFNSSFPYLKIEFFSRPHKPGLGTAARLVRSPKQTIGECRARGKKGQISISSDMTVAELEEQFREVYGLNVQVFRKSGKVWLETTVTDGWTLEEQNRQGEALSHLTAAAGRKRNGNAGDHIN